MDKHQHLLCKYPANPARARGVRARLTASGHSALPRRRRALHMEAGPRADRLRRVLGPGAGAGGSRSGGRVTEGPPARKTESWSSPRLSSPVFFIGPVFYHLSFCPLCFTANTYIPRLRPYFPEQHLKGPKWTAGPRGCAERGGGGGTAQTWPGSPEGLRRGTGGRLGAASQPRARRETGAAQRPAG